MKLIWLCSVFCFISTTFTPFDSMTSLMLSFSTLVLTIVPGTVVMSRSSTLILSSFFAWVTSTSASSSSPICFTRSHTASTSSRVGNMELSGSITPISMLRPLVILRNSSRISSAVMVLRMWRSTNCFSKSGMMASPLKKLAIHLLTYCVLMGLGFFANMVSTKTMAVESALYSGQTW